MQTARGSLEPIAIRTPARATAEGWIFGRPGEEGGMNGFQAGGRRRLEHATLEPVGSIGDERTTVGRAEIVAGGA